MSEVLPPVIIELKALGGELKAKIGEAKAELTDLEAHGNSRMQALGSAGKIAAGGLAVIAAATIGAGVEAVKMASEFEESTTQIVTGAGESEANIELVRKGILAMAGATGTMPQELSKGFYLIASAGYHGAQGLDVLKAAAEGAKVGGADMAVVANGLTTALTDYNIPASRSNAVTSALVQTVADGKMKMQDLANSLGMVMPKASAMGVSFQDVTGALATMTAAGFTARRASMNLANTVLALGAPGKAASNALKEIGLSAQQVKDDLSTKGLAGTLELIEDHVGKKFPKGSVAAVTALKDITGGATGYGTTLALTGSHMAAFEANVKNIGGALHGQTKTVQGFSTVQKDLSFQMEAAKATINAWGISLGTMLLPIVTKAMTFINTTGIPAVKNFATEFATHALPVIKQVAAFITGTVIPALTVLAGFVIGTLIPGIVHFGQFLYNAREPLAIVAGVITALLLPAMIQMAVQAAISGAETVAIWVMLQASAIASTASQVAQFVIGGAKWLWAGAQAVAGAAMQVGAWVATGVAAMANAAVIAAAWLISMGPIVLVIAAVVALGILIATHMDQIKHWIGDAWTWVKSATETVWNGIKAALTTVWDWIKAAVVAYFDAYKLIITTAFTVVEAVVQAVWSAIQSAISAAVEAVRATLNWFAGLGSLFSGWFSDAYNAATGALGNLLSFVGTIPSRILYALGNMGSLLVGVGVNIVQGLISGISSMAGTLTHALLGILPGPLQKFAGMLGIASPSKVFAGYGLNIVQGLIQGIEGHKGALAGTMAGLGSMTAGPAFPGVAPLSAASGFGPTYGGSSSSGHPQAPGPSHAAGGGNIYIDYKEAHQPPQQVARALMFEMTHR